MFKLTFTFKTIDELKEKFTAVLSGFGEQQVVVESNAPILKSQSIAVEAEQASDTHVGTVEKSTGKKRGRKPNAEKQAADAPAAEEVEAHEPVEAKAAQTTVVTREDMKAAIQKVLDHKNVDAAREILRRFGANRLPEIKEEQFGDIIKACDEALA